MVSRTGSVHHSRSTEEVGSIPRTQAGAVVNLSAILHYLVDDWAELAGFLTTFIGIWLTTKRLLLCWPVVLAADIFYFVVFFQARLFSDAFLQVFFILFTLYGWWHWWRGVRHDGEV